MLKGLNYLLSDTLFKESAVGKELLEKPLGFIDIGARGGVHSLVEPLADCTAVLAFEPDEDECARLLKKQKAKYAAIEILPVALADKEGEKILYKYASPVNNSLRPENTYAINRYKINTFQRIGTIPIQTTTLDKVLFEKTSLLDTYGEFIKLDTQGTEWEILQGAQRVLEERTLAIILEADFFPYYEGQKLFSDVEIFLRKRGFFFYGFMEMHYRSCKSLDKLFENGRERTFWGDAVFFKDPIPMGTSTSKTLTKRGAYVLFALALLTGYYDFALELALKEWAKGEESIRIANLVHGLSYLDPRETYTELLSLVERVKANPETANIEVGRFVDNRRHINDYDDIPILESKENIR